MLQIKNLHVKIDGKEILKGINLEVKAGEVHAIMGPNGSGKSTLSYIMAGKDGYEVTKGSILYNQKNLLEMSIEDRSRAGLFLAFQYPLEIPGVSITNFLKTAVNEHRKYKKMEPIDAMDFLATIKEKAAMVGLNDDLLKRAVNQGFSGGEKKRNEVFQMAILDPMLAVLDETDSGLDIDALKTVADGVNKLKTKDNAFIVITHYQRLLDHIVPDKVHILADGNIIQSGDKELAYKLEAKGYNWILNGSDSDNIKK